MKVVPWSLFRLVCLEGVDDVDPEIRPVESFVYIAASASGVVKVGMSVAPAIRVHEFGRFMERAVLSARVGFPVTPYRLIAQIPDGARRREKAIHNALKGDAIGHEYFRGSKSQGMVEAIEKLPLPIRREPYLDRDPCRDCGAKYPEHSRACRHQGRFWSYLDSAGLTYPTEMEAA